MFYWENVTLKQLKISKSYTRKTTSFFTLFEKIKSQFLIRSNGLKYYQKKKKFVSQQRVETQFDLILT